MEQNANNTRLLKTYKMYSKELLRLVLLNPSLLSDNEKREVENKIDILLEKIIDIRDELRNKKKSIRRVVDDLYDEITIKYKPNTKK